MAGKIGVWGMVKQNIIPVAAVVATVGGVVVLGSLFGIQGFPTFSAAGAAIPGGAGAPAQVGASGGICDDPVDASFFAQYENYALSPMQSSGAATNAAFYVNGLPIAKNTSATSASAYTTLTDVIPCGQVFHVIFGDGTSYYYQDVTKFTAGDYAGQDLRGNQELVDIVATLKPIESGTLAVRIMNDSNQWTTQVGADFTAAGTNRDTTIRVKQTDASAFFGDGKYMISMAGNSLNYSTFTLNPTTSGVSVGTAETCPTSVSNHYAALDASMKVMCYPVTATEDAFGMNGDFTHEFDLLPTSASGAAPTTGRNNVSIGVSDWANRIESGAIVWGYDTLTNTDMGATNVYLDQAIVPW